MFVLRLKMYKHAFEKEKIWCLKTCCLVKMHFSKHNSCCRDRFNKLPILTLSIDQSIIAGVTKHAYKLAF